MKSISKLIAVVTLLLILNEGVEGNDLSSSGNQSARPMSFRRQQMIQDVKKRIMQYQQLLAYNQARLQTMFDEPQTMFDEVAPANNPVTMRDVVQEMIARQMRKNALNQKLNARSNKLNNRRFQSQGQQTQNGFLGKKFIDEN